MPTEHFPETDPDEIEYSNRVWQLLQRVDELSDVLDEHVSAAPGSQLSIDDARTPHFPVSHYGFVQLRAAVGCLQSLGYMIVREDKKSISIVAGPFGAYALVRNALDCAATAMWLLEPGSSTLRVKRRIMLEVDEVRNSGAFRQSAGDEGWKGWQKEYWERLQEVAEIAEVGAWNPLSKQARMPRMTDILRALERHHDNAVLPWLSAWQLASGHAHGKVWAQLASNRMDEITDSRTETGATYRVTIRYGIVAFLLLEAFQLLEAAGARYLELNRGH